MYLACTIIKLGLTSNFCVKNQLSQTAKIDNLTMTRYRYHLTTHAKEETIPLRTGIIPKLNKVFLDDIEIDEEGTAQQTKGQRDLGRYHILANVWLSQFGDERLPGRWRLVTAEPDREGLALPIFTLLPPDRSSARSEANLTDFLKNERQKNDKPWFTTEYIAKTLHPLLRDGHIRNQNDLSNHLNTVLLQPVLSAKNEAEQKSLEAQMARENAERARDISEKEMVLALEEKKKALFDKDLAESLALDVIQEKDAAEQKASEARKEKELADKRAAEAEQAKYMALDRAEKAESDLRIAQKLLNEKANAITSSEVSDPMLQPAQSVTKPWPSKTGGPYKNVGIEATIVNVRASGNKIFLTYLDKNCLEKTVDDFGYQGFVSPVFDYLKLKEGKRALFLLTWKNDEVMKLASDTMMLRSYAGLWQ
jgi:hypothetical protein